MARHLVQYVWLEDEEHGRAGFGPGDVVPAWAEALITNPDAWSDGDGGGPAAAPSSTPDAPAPVTPPEPPAPAGGAGGEGLKPPPKVGKGSGRDAWVDYATALGIETPEDANRAAVMAAVDAHTG